MNGEQALAIKTGNNCFSIEMTDRVYRQFSELIYAECGIKLGESRKIMLGARLNKRLRALSMDSYDKYFDYIQRADGGCDELIRMINAVSTNKTEFFREREQFDFLFQKALPALVQHPYSATKIPLDIWSAGCSSGEEAYTLAFICAEFFSSGNGPFNILATDISTSVLETARAAIYPDNAMESIPSNLKRKYLMRGKGPRAGYHRIVPELVQRTRFIRHNLIRDDFSALPMMSIIFCRNVVIYFDHDAQAYLYQKLIDRLLPGGFLFIGHSETIYRTGSALLRMAPAIYRKIEQGIEP